MAAESDTVTPQSIQEAARCWPIQLLRWSSWPRGALQLEWGPSGPAVAQRAADGARPGSPCVVWLRAGGQGTCWPGGVERAQQGHVSLLSPLLPCLGPIYCKARPALAGLSSGTAGPVWSSGSGRTRLHAGPEWAVPCWLWTLLGRTARGDIATHSRRTRATVSKGNHMSGFYRKDQS